MAMCDYAYALSCARPQGDQVLNVLENTDAPVWFGQAKLLETKEVRPQIHPHPVKARFQIQETYLLTGLDAIEDEVEVLVPGLHVTWGIWGDTGSPKKIKRNQAGNYYFRYDQNDGWVFGGPGACTFFSEEEWANLKSGFYKDSGNINEDDPSEDCANPITQTDMNICSAKDYSTSRAELDEVYQRALEDLKDNSEALSEFEKIQTQWENYSNLNCDYNMNMYEGGSIAPLIYATCMDRLTKQRITTIKNMFPEWDN